MGTAPFFALAFAITWGVQLPALLVALGVLPGPIERFMPLAGLGAFGPLLAAVSVARRAPGGARGLFTAPRVAARWYVVALVLPGLLLAAGMAVYLLLGGDGQLVYPPTNGERIAALIVFPLGEEVGWRGLALPRLQARHGPIAASVIVGLLWGLWHVPMFVIAGGSAPVFALSLVMLVAGSFVFTWLYNRTRGSLLLAILLHVGVHLSNPNLALPDAAPLVIYTLALMGFAALVVRVDPVMRRR